MTLSARVLSILLHTFVLSLLNTSSNGTSSDIYCLKSIKDSLEDPFNYLNSSWNFNNNKEGFICDFTGVDCWHPEENKVLNIRLSAMGLKGQFPRGIANCMSLTGLDLSLNELSGPVPSDIDKMIPSVTSLDLSSNRFSGVIPPSLANSTYLNVLKLDDNQLTGEIPPQLGQLNRIKTFTVAGNSLSGPVPNFVNATITVDSYGNNKGLCGKPLEACSKGHPKKFDFSFKSGFLFGWVVSAVSVVTVFMIYCMPTVHEKKMKLMMPMTTKLMTRRENKRKEAIRMSKLPTVEVLQEGSKEISMLEKLVTRMSFTELIAATNNFSEENIIGLGNLGIMYKAVLMNGWFLAVKRFRDFQQSEKQFLSEIMALGRLRHSSLVSLLGFCIDGKERVLVYKYMANGNLYDWLHPLEAKAKFLEWPLRVRIGIGLARGLAWLHHNCKFRITHGNISSKCILLDQNFEPKISNFGGAMIMKSNDIDSNRYSSINSEISKWGYVSYEYGLLLDTSKKDVYSFGIVLLEMVTGEKPNEVSNASNSFSGTLVEWITHLWDASGGLYNAIENSLVGQGFDGEIFQFLKVACNCVKSSPNERPTMLEVYKILTAIGGRYGIADDPEILTKTECEIADHRDEHTRDKIIEEI